MQSNIEQICELKIVLNYFNLDKLLTHFNLFTINESNCQKYNVKLN